MFMKAVIMQAMDQFGPIILKTIMDGTHGTDFAEEIRSQAEAQYHMIAGLGVEGVMDVLRTHPSTAGAVVADPVAVREFADQFCHPEKYPDVPEAGAGAAGAVVSTPPATEDYNANEVQ
jgi:hypothetical protein